jgi:hypothetical protein
MVDNKKRIHELFISEWHKCTAPNKPDEGDILKTAPQETRQGTNTISYESGLWVKGFYADSQALVGSYLETIYT